MDVATKQIICISVSNEKKACAHIQVLMDEFCMVLQVSNIIFVDSPVGAGFSYAATQEGSKTSDTKTVKQLVIFLRKVTRC